jgi:hypothetical protein
MHKYMKALLSSGYSPNFYCSEEYWEKAEWVYRSDKDNCWMEDADGERMLPTLYRPVLSRIQACKFVLDPSYPFFAGFSDMSVNGILVDTRHKVLDWEFLYSPSEFLNLSGSRWRPLRKNVNKVKRELGESLEAKVALHYTCPPDFRSFVVEWAEENKGIEFYDPEVMTQYFYGGNNRLFIKGQETGKIYAVCVWDDNFKYINFRYCFCLGKQKGISDYARVLFYQYIAQLDSQILVNDGGSLDSDGLFRYKKKLNPVRINTIRSLI